MNNPVTFEKIEYIRVGSYTKKLNDYPIIQSQLWDKIKNEKFEEQFAETDLSEDDAIRKLDYSVYFERYNIPLPSTLHGVAKYMIEEKVIQKLDSGLFAITNLGAIVFAKNLNEFDNISRKALRIVKYEGKSRVNILKDEIRCRGYAADFEETIKFIEALLPSHEVIAEDGIRKTKKEFPSIAIREIIANALIHQDFSVSGTGPLVEIFDNRVEITNSGLPLVDILRIIDNPPCSRNEKLASLLRRLRMCEELGTGWDKIILVCEYFNLQAPLIDLYHNTDSIKITIFSHRNFSDISLEDKIWSTYLHCCIKYVQGDYMSNKSLRERFGLASSSISSVSRLISATVEKGLIKSIDPTTAPRYMKYTPIWA